MTLSACIRALVVVAACVLAAPHAAADPKPEGLVFDDARPDGLAAELPVFIVRNGGESSVDLQRIEFVLNGPSNTYRTTQALILEPAQRALIVFSEHAPTVGWDDGPVLWIASTATMTPSGYVSASYIKFPDDKIARTHLLCFYSWFDETMTRILSQPSAKKTLKAWTPRITRSADMVGGDRGIIEGWAMERKVTLNGRDAPDMKWVAANSPSPGIDATTIPATPFPDQSHPEPPVILHALDDTMITFAARPSGKTLNYEFQFSLKRDFADLLTTETSSTPQVEIAADRLRFGTIYWRVRCEIDGTVTPWSYPGFTEIKEAPQADQQPRTRP